MAYQTLMSRDELKRAYEIYKSGNKDWDDIRDQLGLECTGQAVRHRVRRFVQNGMAESEYINHDRRSAYLTMDEVVEDTESLYTPYPAEFDDSPKWEQFKEQLFESRQGMISIAVLSDLHIPDHNQQAVDLTCQVIEAAQPDITLWNGDQFDFDRLSRFPTDRRRNTGRGDVFDEIQKPWDRTTKSIQSAAPRTRQVAQPGNHDWRVQKWLSDVGGAVATTVERAFVNVIRSNDRVWWLGQYQETQIGDTLLIQHGKRVGENAAKMAMLDMGGIVTIVQGHNHFPALYQRRVNLADQERYRIISGVSVGCLCNTPAAYQVDSKNPHKWLNGIGILHVDTRNGIVNVQQVLYHRDLNSKKMIAVFGDKKFTA